jgi:hypothetical protein
MQNLRYITYWRQCSSQLEFAWPACCTDNRVVQGTKKGWLAVACSSRLVPHQCLYIDARN